VIKGHFLEWELAELIERRAANMIKIMWLTMSTADNNELSSRVAPHSCYARPRRPPPHSGGYLAAARG
jgi:hypothetical protein